MSEKSSGVQNVRREIAIVAGPREWGATRESWLAIVPRKVKTVSFRTVKALWYGEITDPSHWAARDIARAANAIQQGRAEAQAAALRVEQTIGGLNARDPDFHREDILALISALHALRGLDRT